MRVTAVAMLLAACGFDPLPAGTGTDASTSPPGDGPMGQTDPCSINNGGCAIACTNADGSAVCFAPETCGQVVGLADNTSTTLYVGGSATEPWTAYCHSGLEYLTVSSTTNFGQYTAGNNSPGSNVRTDYARIRVDPATLDVDICDETFATSTGELTHDPGGGQGSAVTSMPLGIAMDCKADFSSSGVAGVDLTGTPFVVVSSWASGGYDAAGGADAMMSGRTTTLTGGGACGWYGPANTPNNPFNTFANSTLITLSYKP